MLYLLHHLAMEIFTRIIKPNQYAFVCYGMKKHHLYRFEVIPTDHIASKMDIVRDLNPLAVLFRAWPSTEEQCDAMMERFQKEYAEEQHPEFKNWYILDKGDIDSIFVRLSGPHEIYNT